LLSGSSAKPRSKSTSAAQGEDLVQPRACQAKQPYRSACVRPEPCLALHQRIGQDEQALLLDKKSFPSFLAKAGNLRGGIS